MRVTVLCAEKINRVKLRNLQAVNEVAFWCSLQSLRGFHVDSPDQARRRELMKEANLLLAKYRSPTSVEQRFPYWARQHLPHERRLAKAFELIAQADPQTLLGLEHQLRSPTLKPAGSIGGCAEGLNEEIIEDVIKRRSSLLKLQLSESQAAHVQYRGRLLAYVPNENVADGGSQYCSSGFFDVYDCPPWDSWIQYSNKTLISWVPEVLIPLAQAGIDVNPVECIRWVD